MSKIKKIKTMSYLPLNLSENTTVSLNGYSINFSGTNGYDYVNVGNNYIDIYFQDDAKQTNTNFYQDAGTLKLEQSNTDNKRGQCLISPLDITIQSFDTSISANPSSQVIAHSNGDVLLNSQRIQVNGQLGLNGEYQVGDKTFTIINGIITAII